MNRNRGGASGGTDSKRSKAEARRDDRGAKEWSSNKKTWYEKLIRGGGKVGGKVTVTPFHVSVAEWRLSKLQVAQGMKQTSVRDEMQKEVINYKSNNISKKESEWLRAGNLSLWPPVQAPTYVVMTDGKLHAV